MALSNGDHSGNSIDADSRPLKVIIAGAGIGGLCAAIGLRQQGHDVTIYETSRMAQETGAAIHIAPNCNGLLKRLGIDARKHGSVELFGITEYLPSGIMKFSMDTRPINRMWQHPWDLIHRAHLHSALKDLAVSPDSNGKAVQLNLSSGVESVNPTNASVTLADGSQVHGDLVIGADGVHSNTRKAIPGGNLVPFDSGKTAYRFLVPTDLIASTPTTSSILQHENHLIMWVAENRRLVMYPCVGGTMMNFVAMFPSEESSKETGGDSWQQTGNKSKMLSIFSSFGEQVRAILGLVDESMLKTWTLLDMEKMPSFVHLKLAVIGDAAHPFLPHQAQGGAQAIEDAMSIAAVLPFGTRPDEISARLAIYQSQRYERSHRIQQATRDSGADLSKGQQLDMQSFTAYNVGHDEWHSSTAALQEYLASANSSLRWRNPIGFGPVPSPRQPLGLDINSREVGELRQRTPETTSGYSVRFKSSRTYLQQLLPPGFSFASPATVCEVTLSCRTLDGMAWLGGGSYNLIMIELHGVQYLKQNGERVFGSFVPLVLENLADPIITGRDELGMPKLFSDIAVATTAGGVEVTMSWRNSIFGKISLRNLAEEPAVNGTANGGVPQNRPPGPPAPEEVGQFWWRYVPAVGQPEKADAAYPVLFAKPAAAQSDTRTCVSQEASFEFHAGDWTSLPTLHNITRVLSEMPNYGLVQAKHVTATGVDDLSSAHRID